MQLEQNHDILTVFVFCVQRQDQLVDPAGLCDPLVVSSNQSVTLAQTSAKQPSFLLCSFYIIQGWNLFFS